MSAQPAVASSSSNFKTILLVIGSCAIGASVGYLCVKLLITQFHLSAKSITSADAVALWLGIAFLGVGAMLAFVSTNRTMLARSMDVQLWRAGDEYGGRMMLIVAASAFAIGQALLFLWGAAERLGLTTGISGWSAIILLMSCYVAVGFYHWFSLRWRLRSIRQRS